MIWKQYLYKLVEKNILFSRKSDEVTQLLINRRLSAVLFFQKNILFS